MTDMERAAEARNAADAAMGTAGAARTRAEDALRQAEADLHQANSAYENLLARASEGEPVEMEELVAAKAAEREAEIHRDLSRAMVTAATKRYEKAHLEWLRAMARVIQHEMAAAVSSRIEAARAVATKVRELEAALEVYHQSANRISSAAFANREHMLQVSHAKQTNPTVAALPPGHGPITRIPEMAPLPRLGVALIRADAEGHRFLQSGRRLIVAGDLGDVEAAGWVSLRLPQPEPLPDETAEAAA